MQTNINKKIFFDCKVMSPAPHAHTPAPLTHLLTTGPSSLTVSLATTRGSSTLLQAPINSNAWWMEKNTMQDAMKKRWSDRNERWGKKKKQMRWKDCRFLTNLFEVALRWGQVRGWPRTTVLRQRSFTFHLQGPFNTTGLTLVHCLLSGTCKTFAFSKCHLDQRVDYILSNLIHAV